MSTFDVNNKRWARGKKRKLPTPAEALKAVSENVVESLLVDADRSARNAKRKTIRPEYLELGR